jgi:hypothetical protein
MFYEIDEFGTRMFVDVAEVVEMHSPRSGRVLAVLSDRRLVSIVYPDVETAVAPLFRRFLPRAQSCAQAVRSNATGRLTLTRRHGTRHGTRRTGQSP